MEDKINLSALTTQVHKKKEVVENTSGVISQEEEIMMPTLEAQELEESIPETISQKAKKERKKPLTPPCRVILSKENTARIDLMRISSEDSLSRPEMVNMIIEHYFEERAQKLSVNIQTIIDNL